MNEERKYQLWSYYARWQQNTNSELVSYYDFCNFLDEHLHLEED